MKNPHHEQDDTEMNAILLRISRHVNSLADQLALAEDVISGSLISQKEIHPSAISSAQQLDFIHQSLEDLSHLIKNLATVPNNMNTSELKMESTKSIINCQNTKYTAPSGNFDLF